MGVNKMSSTRTIVIPNVTANADRSPDRSALTGCPWHDVKAMMQMQNLVLASTESVATPVRLITATTIRDFLAAHDVALAKDVSDAQKAIVRIICVRR